MQIIIVCLRTSTNSQLCTQCTHVFSKFTLNKYNELASWYFLQYVTYDTNKSERICRTANILTWQLGRVLNKRLRESSAFRVHSSDNYSHTVHAAHRGVGMHNGIGSSLANKVFKIKFGHWPVKIIFANMTFPHTFQRCMDEPFSHRDFALLPQRRPDFTPPLFDHTEPSSDGLKLLWHVISYSMNQKRCHAEKG